MQHKLLKTIQKIPRTIIIGLAAGIFSGLFGIGGGIVLVPSLIYLLKIPQIAAQGTALLVIIPTAVSGSIKYHLNGYLDLELCIWLATGSMIGVLAGSLFAHQLQPETLRKLFGTLMVIVAIKMFIG